MDGSIWPDFTAILDTHEAILELKELEPGQSIKIDAYTITPYKVNHTVPACGYLVEDERERRFFYTGDTGPSGSTWEEIGEKQIHCLIIDVSFPNHMEQIAIKTGHLTPQLLKQELLKIKLTISVPSSEFITPELVASRLAAAADAPPAVPGDDPDPARSKGRSTPAAVLVWTNWRRVSVWDIGRAS